ncbi:MAG TPA: hypothetical protein VGB30_00775 [bacterium]|jgi:hypothetical protein
MSQLEKIDIKAYRDEMTEFPSLRNPADRHKKILRWLTRLSTDLGCPPPVLVGCGAVEVYTDAQTATGDVDIIAPDLGKLWSALLELGFQRSSDQRFSFHQSYSLLFEFPSDKLREGEETVSIDIDGVECKVISPEDLVIDRLEMFEATNSGTDLVYAYMIYHGLHDKLNHKKIVDRVKKSDLKNIFKFIHSLHIKAKDEGISIDEQGSEISEHIRRKMS